MPCFRALQCTPPSFSHPASESPFCNVPRFQAHQPISPSSSPPESESSFPTCHVSELTNPLLPLPPLQDVSPRFHRATFPSSPTLSFLYLLPTLIAMVPAYSLSQPHLPHLLYPSLPPSPTE